MKRFSESVVEEPRWLPTSFKRRPEHQLEATENGPEHANCGRRRTDADRRDFCAVRDSVRAILAIDRHAQEYAQPPPAHAVWPALVESADVDATRLAKLHQDGY